MISKLTEQQAALLPEFKNAWLKNALSTEPVDHDAAERGIRLAYETIDLKPPKITWLSSPLKGAIAATLLEEKAKTIVSELWAKELDRAREIVVKNVSPEVLYTVKKALMDPVAEQMSNVMLPIAIELEARAGALKMDGAEEVVRELLGQAVFGQFDAGWFCFYDYMERVLGVKEFGPQNNSRLRGLIRATKAGWYWPFEKLVIATEHPTKIVLDDKNKPHNENTNAIEYSDEFSVCCWHGVRVAPEAIFKPDDVKWADVEATAEADLKDALAEIKALKWSTVPAVANVGVDAGTIDAAGVAERYDAAMAVKRLGGVSSLKDMVEAEKII